MSGSRLCAKCIPATARHQRAAPRACVVFDAGVPQVRPFRAAQSPFATAATSSSTGHQPGQRNRSPTYVSKSAFFSTTASTWSGHNRWSKIRHRKGAADAARSAVFSRLTQEIHQSLRSPASFDPSSNPRLAAALAKARDSGVPKVSVENCIARAKAAAEGTGQSVTYEVVGPGGREALIIECLTQNPARTVTRVKEVLNKHACRISSVAFLFEKKGLITITPLSAPDAFDHLFEVAVEHGAEDVREAENDEGPLWEVLTPPTSLSSISNAISTSPHGFSITSQELAYLPIDPLAIGEAEGISDDRAEALDRVVGLLEEEADVVKVWTNLA